jgi:hypothetical protein
MDDWFWGLTCHLGRLQKYSFLMVGWNGMLEITWKIWQLWTRSAYRMQIKDVHLAARALAVALLHDSRSQQPADSRHEPSASAIPATRSIQLGTNRYSLKHPPGAIG